MTSFAHSRVWRPVWVLALFLGLAPQASATVINVTANAVDTAVNGNCSLIEAIQAAESDAAVDACPAGSGADTINVPAGTYTLTVVNNTFSGQNALPRITTTMTIVGAGASSTTITRSGGTLFRFFLVDTPGNLTLNGLTLRNGDSTTGGNDGGAIFSYGTLTVLNSLLTGNLSNNGGSAIFNRGPFSGPGGVANLTDSTLSGNTGSAALETCCAGTTTVTRSTVSGNADGAILNRAGTTTVTNSTLSGNTGDGIDNRDVLIVGFSTIAANTGAGIAQDDSDATTTLGNTIVADNATNCDIADGTFVDGGHNLQFPGTSCGGSIASADPLLASLANNGGTTQTMALGSGSPAIDAADNATCPATDQRGVTRPQDGNNDTIPVCDIGAFEAAPVPIPTLTEWGLILMTVLLISTGIRRLRRTARGGPPAPA